jgi:hypothetical protein
MNGDGARLRAAAEDLQLDGYAREQRQHHEVVPETRTFS